MIAWDLVNSLMRLAITVIIIWKLVRFPNIFNAFERMGMSLAGGCSLLTISVIWQLERSPYDGWAGSVFSTGIFLYFIGRTARHWQHEHNNRLMIDQARRRYDK